MKCLRQGCEYLPIQGLFPHMRSIEVKEGNHRNNQAKRSLSLTQVWSKADGLSIFLYSYSHRKKK